jgi:hypothetical protein
MRSSSISSRDLTSTVLVALAATVYVLSETGVAIPGLGSTRVVAAVIFALGLMTCSAGALMTDFERPGVTRVVLIGLSVAGLATLGVGVAAIVTGSDTLLTVLIGAIAALWCAATVRHALTTPDVPDTEVLPERARDLAGVR